MNYEECEGIVSFNQCVVTKYGIGHLMEIINPDILGVVVLC